MFLSVKLDVSLEEYGVEMSMEALWTYTYCSSLSHILVEPGRFIIIRNKQVLLLCLKNSIALSNTVIYVQLGRERCLKLHLL
jgi:hypothetical protein